MKFMRSSSFTQSAAALPIAVAVTAVEASQQGGQVIDNDGLLSQAA